MELPHLGGKPGEAVPEVDPEDLKALWREQQKIQAMHPGQHATGDRRDESGLQARVERRGSLVPNEYVLATHYGRHRTDLPVDERRRAR